MGRLIFALISQNSTTRRIRCLKQEADELELIEFVHVFVKSFMTRFYFVGDGA